MIPVCLKSRMDTASERASDFGPNDQTRAAFTYPQLTKGRSLAKKAAFLGFVLQP